MRGRILDEDVYRHARCCGEVETVPVQRQGELRAKGGGSRHVSDQQTTDGRIPERRKSSTRLKMMTRSQRQAQEGPSTATPLFEQGTSCVSTRWPTRNRLSRPTYRVEQPRETQIPAATMMRSTTMEWQQKDGCQL